MPRTASKKSSAAKSVATSKKKATTAPAPKKKAKVISHTDDGTPIVNASMAQIRKGLTGKATQQLVRIPQVAERSKFYAEAAEVIGERESLALPYHGSRMWKCEVKVSDGNGVSFIGIDREMILCFAVSLFSSYHVQIINLPKIIGISLLYIGIW